MNRLLQSCSGQRFNALALFLAGSMLLATSTGCLMTPGDGQGVVIGSQTDFLGATSSPGQQVQIQAYYPPWGSWHTFATATSDSNAFNQVGVDLYLWSKTTPIPNWAWHWHGDITQTAKIRVLDQGFGLFGEDTLPTFNSGFFDYYENDESISDLYADHGAGREITVYAQ